MSYLSLIKTQMISDIESTSVEKAFDGFAATDCRNYPYAQIAIVSSDMNPYMTSVFDRIFRVTVWITAKTAEAVEGAIEELSRYYLDPTRHGVLQSLGAVVMLCTGQSTAIQVAGMTEKEFYGSVDYELRMRYFQSS